MMMKRDVGVSSLTTVSLCKIMGSSFCMFRLGTCFLFAIVDISYTRGLFLEKYFNDKSVPALEMKIKKLMLMDAKSHRLLDWMEKGVNDCLQKKYLKTLLFCVCETVEGPMTEEYTFCFSYSNSESQEKGLAFM